MPGIWDYLTPEIIAAGPRRVELKPHAPSGAVLYELRVPHAPLLSTDEPPLDDHPDIGLPDGNVLVWQAGRYVWEKA